MAVAESASTVDGDSEEEHFHCHAFDSSQSQSSSKTPDTSTYSDATLATRPIDIQIKPGMSVKDVSQGCVNCCYSALKR